MIEKPCLFVFAAGVTADAAALRDDAVTRDKKQKLIFVHHIANGAGSAWKTCTQSEIAISDSLAEGNFFAKCVEDGPGKIPPMKDDGHGKGFARTGEVFIHFLLKLPRNWMIYLDMMRNNVGTSKDKTLDASV